MSLSRALLSPEELQAALAQLPEWELKDQTLIREYELPDFATAIALVTIIATLAEKVDHHPDLYLHSWNRLRVLLTTHSAGGITSYDTHLAQQIEQYAQALSGAR